MAQIDSSKEPKKKAAKVEAKKEVAKAETQAIADMNRYNAIKVVYDGEQMAL